MTGGVVLRPCPSPASRLAGVTDGYSGANTAVLLRPDPDRGNWDV